MSSALEFFVTAPRGLAPLLGEELQDFAASAATRVRVTPAGVRVRAGLEFGYRACLWSRLANRVLLAIHHFPAPDAQALYTGIRAIDWRMHLTPRGTFAVGFNAAQSHLTHTHYGALRVKDAIVDQLREAWGERPSVDRERPDVRIEVYLFRDRATVSIDLAGESLHRRGYRGPAAAPLKENLAAAILLRAGWPEVARRGGTLLDPMCGSGTLVVEGALLAADVAPGLLRNYFGFRGWRGHDAPLCARLTEAARARALAARGKVPPIVGADADARALTAARACAERAGVGDLVRLEQHDVTRSPLPRSGARAGLVVVNPPYGERLGERAALVPLYRHLGERLRCDFAGWRAAVLTADGELASALGLRRQSSHRLWNGPIACRLLRLRIESPRPAIQPGNGHAVMLENRLRKNLRHLGRWTRRETITCYRLYDADLPEYAFAIDLYHGDGRDDSPRVHVQEYAPPPQVPARDARVRREQALATIQRVLDIPPEWISLRVRRRQRGSAQYQTHGHEGRLYPVRERDLRFLVNFDDFLDTGLFLDQRPTRDLIRSLAGGRRFLNLFAYTCAATVAAAAGGARATTSIDLSAGRLAWARRNFELNGMAQTNHTLVCADCLRWLDEQTRGGRPAPRYDLIWLDPPTFSNSKGLRGSFDVQRDHQALIAKAAGLLTPGGVLLFSTNYRRFRLQAPARPQLEFEDISRATIPLDFARNPHIHRCWRVTRAASESICGNQLPESVRCRSLDAAI